MKPKSLLFLFVGLIALSCESDEAESPADPSFQLQDIRIGNHKLGADTLFKMPVDQPLSAVFSYPLDKSAVPGNINLKVFNGQKIPLNFIYFDQDHGFVATSEQELEFNTVYELTIGNLLSADGRKFGGASFIFKTKQGEIVLESLTIDGIDILQTGRILDISLKPEIMAIFSHPVLFQPSHASLAQGGTPVPIDAELQEDGRTLLISPQQILHELKNYAISISGNLSSSDERVFQGFEKSFYTQLDSIYKYPQIPDDELLTLVQQRTFGYFWDFAHPASGMARERNTSGNLVTSGGSGFGIMAIIVGIERGFISRNEGLERMQKIAGFLENADRFHGAWSHWIDGNTGKVIPFSQKDNGGDLVETAFLVQGLLTFRQYLDENVPSEKELIDRINALWRDVEWDWYTKGGEQVLYWHWSPDYEWEMNHPVRGYNEALIAYVLAASSPTHPIPVSVYHQGWAGNGNIRNGREYEGIMLPLGFDYGGPLFFAHYSFLGLDPRGLKDQYADYWVQNVNHSLINQSYSARNPQVYVGYGENIWGLTASDNQNGYSAHSPTNDLGVIAPTAAISSIPYTPEKSMNALKTFYYFLGDRLWGQYGFYDAFNATANWYAKSYLAIDHGPIVIMIENYRTGLLWDLFMSVPEVKEGLAKLDFIITK